MSYIVHQPIKGRLYAYEVVGKWDPSTRNSKQKRTYIGRVDENGNIIPKGSRPAITKIDGAYDFGDLFLVLRISEELNLTAIVKEVFHEDAYPLLILAANRIIASGSMDLVDVWLSRTYAEMRMPGQRISELLERAEKGAMEFATRWMRSSQKEDAIYFDITSLESYSAKNRFMEWGYSRSGKDEKQINLGIIMGRSMRPLFFEFYPGSIPDVKTLIRVLEMLKRHDITSVILVLDRGFYAAYNLRAMKKFSFVMPLPFKTNAASEIIRICRHPRNENARMHDGKLLFVDSGTVQIDGIDLHYIHFLDPEREEREKRRFFEKLMQVESELEHITDVTRVDELAGRWRKFLSIGSGLTIRRKTKAITRRLSRMGRTILISDLDLTWNEALDLYRSRDRVEKGFRNMKSDLGTLPMGVHGDETIQGYLLVQFIALIIEFEIRKRMRGSAIKGMMSMRELLMEMSKLRMVKQGDSKMLTEITKKQRGILEAMSIKEKDLVIN
jgi:transposase